MCEGRFEGIFEERYEGRCSGMGGLRRVEGGGEV